MMIWLEFLNCMDFFRQFAERPRQDVKILSVRTFFPENLQNQLTRLL